MTRAPSVVMIQKEVRRARQTDKMRWTCWAPACSSALDVFGVPAPRAVVRLRLPRTVNVCALTPVDGNRLHVISEALHSGTATRLVNGRTTGKRTHELRCKSGRSRTVWQSILARKVVGASNWKVECSRTFAEIARHRGETFPGQVIPALSRVAVSCRCPSLPLSHVLLGGASPLSGMSNNWCL